MLYDQYAPPPTKLAAQRFGSGAAAGQARHLPHYRALMANRRLPQRRSRCRLEPVLGPQQAIWLAAGFFGLIHYFGDPPGLQGVLLTAYLGWIAAKSMIETRSIVWAFLIHFVANVIIYFFWALVAA